MNDITEDLDILYGVFKNALTENNATIHHSTVRKKTGFIDIQYFFDGRYWGLYCYENTPSKSEENSKNSQEITYGELVEDVPMEEIRALGNILENALTENKATDVESLRTLDFYVGVKYKFGGREYSLHSYLTKKRVLM